MARDEIHPEVMQAIKAVELPEVQEMMQRLAKYGLAIAVPHMHGEDGEFLPLPTDKVSCELGLEVSFRDADDPEVLAGIPVMWRSEWDGESKPAAACVRRCILTAICGHHGRHRG